MNRNEFEQLLQLVLDGEAGPDEKARFEEALEASAAFRARRDFETRLRGRLREALEEAPDMLARARVLQGFRAALVADAAPRAGAGWRRFLVPAAAAAAIVFAFWLGSRTGDDSGSGAPRPDPSLQAELDAPEGARDIVSAINVSETYFRAEVEAERAKVGCARRSTENCLIKEADARVWKNGCGVDCQKRMEEARALAARCVGDDLASLGLPEGFELVGMRMTRLSVGAESYEVPHLVFVSEQSRVSAYLLCDRQCDTITDGLHRLDEGEAKGENCLWGCPQRGLVVRRVGKAWIALSSDLGMDRLTEIASDF